MKKKVRKAPSKKQSFGQKLWAVSIIIGTFLILPLFAGSFFWSKTIDQPCANSISCIKDLSGKVDESAKEGVFLGKRVEVLRYLTEDSSPPKAVLGSSTQDKRIEVDLSKQRLFAYEGDKVVYEFPVSTGKWGRTPTGTFTIWIKLRATRMSGGQGSDYYNLPNVPYTMFFSNQEVSKSRGFSIHGAYWHNNFGHTMSHGCVNMRPDDAKTIFDWANPPIDGYSTYATEDNPGTKVIIFGDPKSD